MNDGQTIISPKTLLLLTGIFGAVAVLLVTLNLVNEHRKRTQYESFYKDFIASEYPKVLGDLMTKNALSDSAKVEELGQVLDKLKEQHPYVHQSAVLIPQAEHYDELKNAREGAKPIKHELVDDPVKKAIAYLESSPSPNVDSLYALTKEEAPLRVILKLGDGFLCLNHDPR